MTTEKTNTALNAMAAKRAESKLTPETQRRIELARKKEAAGNPKKQRSRESYPKPSEKKEPKIRRRCLGCGIKFLSEGRFLFQCKACRRRS